MTKGLKIQYSTFRKKKKTKNKIRCKIKINHTLRIGRHEGGGGGDKVWEEVDLGRGKQTSRNSRQRGGEGEMKSAFFNCLKIFVSNMKKFKNKQNAEKFKNLKKQNSSQRKTAWQNESSN